MVGIVLDVLVAIKTVEAQRITETLRILANGMTLHQFVDHFGVALNNPLHQSVVLLLGGFGGVADDAVIQVILFQQSLGAEAAVALPFVRSLTGSHLPLRAHQRSATAVDGQFLVHQFGISGLTLNMAFSIYLPYRFSAIYSSAMWTATAPSATAVTT